MHVAFHLVGQPADVCSERLGLSVLDAIRTFCDVCVRIACNEPPRTGQPQSLVRAVLKSHSFGGKSPNGRANGGRKNACITMPAFSEGSACVTLLAVAVISV